MCSQAHERGNEWLTTESQQRLRSYHCSHTLKALMKSFLTLGLPATLRTLVCCEGMTDLYSYLLHLMRVQVDDEVVLHADEVQR